MIIRQYIRYILPPVIYVVAFLQMTAKKTWYDPDTFWHIKLGQTMVEQKRLINEAIYSFGGNHLPYVPHELGFQWIVGWLYDLAGWKAIHILTVVCVGFLVCGLYELVKVSRKEIGMEEIHPFMILLIPVVALLIFITYFKIRPQMVSAPIILWFFVYLRQFQMNPNYDLLWKLGLLSLLLSNIHAGVWPVIAVFYGMVLIESLWHKNISLFHLWGLLAIGFGGIANTGGWHTLLYFHTIGKTGFEAYISEWQPIHFKEDWVYFVILVIFILSAIYSIKNVFRLFFMIGILYLGVSSYKEHLYMMLFLLYYVAVAIENVPIFDMFKELNWLGKSSYFYTLVSVGLLITLVMGLVERYQEPKEQYPVDEMSYILSHHVLDSRPKVLSTYSTSGYVMFCGGDTLADGRMDPFITPESKGIHDWTAFERSMYAFESDEIMEIIKFDKPDFVIVPKPKQEKDRGWTLQNIAYDHIHKALGQPAFVGSYGEVYHLKR